jgi:hypothetical protein
LAYPSAPDNPTLETIAHSTFGNQVVGNYDTRLATGNAFIYNITTGTYTTNDVPGALSTTAYGIYGNLIAGGYSTVGPGGGVGIGSAYIYNESTGVWTTYNHPGAVETHFEGITGGGQAGSYISSPIGPVLTGRSMPRCSISMPWAIRPGSIIRFPVRLLPRRIRFTGTR